KIERSCSSGVFKITSIHDMRSIGWKFSGGTYVSEPRAQMRRSADRQINPGSGSFVVSPLVFDRHQSLDGIIAVEELLPPDQQVARDDALSALDRCAVEAEVRHVIGVRAPQIEEGLREAIGIFRSRPLHRISPRVFPAPLEPATSVQPGVTHR